MKGEGLIMGKFEIPGYLFEWRPQVAFAIEFAPYPDKPDGLICQQGLSCGHWCSTFYRYCPHCGARIVDEDLVPDYIKEKVKQNAVQAH